MPIIDPSIQLALCTNDVEAIEDNNFFLYYLYNASLNIDHSLEILEAYYQFKNDFISNEKFPNELFKFNYNFLKDFDNPSINNYYEYLYSKFKPEEISKITDIHRGQYFVYEKDKHIGDKIIQSNFFRPVLTKSSFHSWYFTDSPVAILCVNLLTKSKQNQELHITEAELYLINLEIDLIAAAGFSLVLSFITNSHAMKVSPKKKIVINSKEKTLSLQEYFIYNTVTTHNFSEIHFNLTPSDDDSKDKSYYDLILTALVQNMRKINGHFYIYSPYFKETKPASDLLLKVLKNKSRFHVFNFSDDIRLALDLGQLIGSSNNDYKCKPFSYYKTGFDQEKIRIMLCNVPVYSYQDKEINTMPSEKSYLNWAYVSKDDFHSWSPVRVPIILDDTNSHRFLERFINCDDIHAIKPQFFVKDTLYLTRTNRDTLDTVSKIQEKSKDKTIKNQNKNEYEQSKTYFPKKTKKLIKKLLIDVTYALQIHVGNIFLYKSQIFTAFEACQTCFSDEKSLDDKGFIYQVETGEGKSYIIRLIASVISLISQSGLFSQFGTNKKMVHIASSNIQLANRDYEESREFFQSLGLESAVLLHQNELPYYNDEAKKAEKKNLYPDDFFKDSLFENTSNMNYTVCGISTDGIKGKKADIVFSTFVNFESLYLRMMETSTASVGEYFHNCYLLIDEADSILIDELANGTILSRSMKTNCNEVLKFVYKNKMKGKKEKYVYNEVIKRWPNCVDLKLEDILDMYDDIDLINKEEFTNGKKYSIENAEEEVKDKNIIEKIFEKAKNIKDKFSKKSRKSSASKSNDGESTENQDDTEDNLEIINDYTTSTDLSSFVDENKDDTKNQDDDKKDRKKHHKKHHGKEHKKDHSKYLKKNGKLYKIYKEIVPFDYDHKGVLEPNKEFSGFVQQFIAIKERTNNKDLRDLKIKDVSMNYLYVSHPIFVKLYRAVCGFTGTIGNIFEKNILKQQYQLVTKKIPRSKPNKRIELPIVLCNNFEERNQRITNEVLEFHEKEFPVLIIFQDLNEITSVFEMLTARGIEFINIFDGKDEKVKPDFVSGRKGAVSLGTNVCGRGTDIKDPEKPLHVIISYYTTNSRVMQQAFGRTSRQGREGTVSIICLRDQFIAQTEIMKMDSMNEILQDFEVKNKMQKEFIEEFRKRRSWIFDANIVKQKFDSKYIEMMRNSKININRIKAYDFEFPVCMSVETFVKIQSQKIFSLYNCPNCLYTWILFQRYVRELILESWSLFIDRADKSFKRKKKEQPNLSYSIFLEEELNKIKPCLNMYLSNEKTKKIKDPKSNKEITVQRKFGIVDTFMEIFEIVDKLGQKKIENLFPEKLNKFYSSNSKFQFLTFNVGFKPYSLLDNSGAKINSIDGSSQKERNYISDPELKYIIFGTKESFSITRKIDGIFDSICSKINEIIGNYTGLKFFIRRTLGGCEFGVCFDFYLENTNKKLVNDSNCLIDKDPLFLFTIILKSIAPLLAAILIIGLIYLTKVAQKIITYIQLGPVEITSKLVEKVVKKAVKEIVTGALRYQIESFLDKVIDYLNEILEKQLKTLHDVNSKMEEIFRIMQEILAVKKFDKVGEKIEEIFTEKVCNIKVNSEFLNSFLPCGLPVSHLLKIGLLLLLCFASFMMNFNSRKDQLEYKEADVAYKYNKNQDTTQCFEENQAIINNEDFNTVDLNNSNE